MRSSKHKELQTKPFSCQVATCQAALVNWAAITSRYPLHFALHNHYHHIQALHHQYHLVPGPPPPQPQHTWPSTTTTKTHLIPQHHYHNNNSPYNTTTTTTLGPSPPLSPPHLARHQHYHNHNWPSNTLHSNPTSSGVTLWCPPRPSPPPLPRSTPQENCLDSPTSWTRRVSSWQGGVVTVPLPFRQQPRGRRHVPHLHKSHWLQCGPHLQQGAE